MKMKSKKTIAKPQNHFKSKKKLTVLHPPVQEKLPVVKIYVCGPTVYNYVHIGNLRPILTFDIAIRAYHYLKQETFLIHNITDIDDKIIAIATEKKQSEKNVSKYYTKDYLRILNQLNIHKPNQMPNVTDNINLIINVIKRLIDDKYAYITSGNVWFDVTKLQNYGQLSNQKLDKLLHEINHEKHHSADFALWKQTNVGITFPSPWGQGRPGWHTECVALIDKYLNGQSLDIHGGGIDLIFPHHENEQAQFLALYQKDITKSWLHIGHLNVDGLKMSKSLNNVILFKDFLTSNSPDCLRMLFLLSNPQSPINLNLEHLNYSQIMLNKFEKAFYQTQLSKLSPQWNDNETLRHLSRLIISYDFMEAMALINQEIKQFHLNPLKAWIVNQIMQLLGFNFSKQTLKSTDKNLYKKWLQLKQKKQFEAADNIRKKLKTKNLI